VTNSGGLRSFYFRPDLHVERWGPRIGPEAAKYKWLSGLCQIVQAPAMIVWFVCIFVGARQHVAPLEAVGVIILVAAVGVYLECLVFARRAKRAAAEYSRRPVQPG
jgi:hypothetical protein